MNVIIFTNFFENVWKFLSSKTAFYIYASIILILIIVLLVIVYSNYSSSFKFNLNEKNKNFENVKNDEVKIIFNGSNHDNISNSELKESEQEDEASRFYMLTKIDKKMESYVPPKYDDDISLEEFCIEFRKFSAGKLHLYYDIEDIRRFVASLAVTKLIILQGMSGTGKTSLAYAFGEFVDNEAVVIPIQPMWKERTDLIGYYNEFTKKFNETTMLCTLYEANLNNDLYALVLDEMNIARIEYYFAEFLSLLELPNPEGRNLDVVSDKWENDPKLLKNGKLRLPVNMWFIGTANNDDSTFAISDKVYDRAMPIDINEKGIAFEPDDIDALDVNYSYLNGLFEKAMVDYAISASTLKKIDDMDNYTIKHFRVAFGNRIVKHMRKFVPVYVACGGDETDAVDYFMAKKVLRKFEGLNLTLIRDEIDGYIEFLDKNFGKGKMAECIEFLLRLKKMS